MDQFTKKRRIMKANFTELHKIETDQMKNLPQPPLEKSHDDARIVSNLPPPKKIELKEKNIFNCIKSRKSRRNFTSASLSLEELSFLLWSTQGVKDVIKRFDRAYATLRTVPSAGARHPFETYLVIQKVTGLEPGIYRYMATEHCLEFLYNGSDLKTKILEATFDQKFSANCAVVFIWSCVPYRGEWRYGISAHKAMLLDAGHVCQNLYLACEALQIGTCAIAAYDQEKVDKIIQVDRKDEFTVYLAPVGKY